MSTSERTFEQVKNILGKLDRNIDAARARRLHDDTPPGVMHGRPAAIGATQPTPPSTAHSAPALIGGSTPQTSNSSHSTPHVPAKPPMPSKSGFGRARPLRPNGGMTGAASQS